MDLFGNDKMLALSWRQPYAQLMLHGKVETRVWDTSYRGLVLICASQKPYSEADLFGIAGVAGTQRIFNFLNERGIREVSSKAIAVGRLVSTRLMLPSDENHCFVKYKEPWIEERKSKKTGITKFVKVKLYCHFYEDVRAIEPFDWKGAQGWKKVEQSIIDKIKYL